MESETALVRIEAGPHTRTQCPVSFVLPEQFRKGASVLLHEDGTALVVQSLPNGAGVTILPELAAGTNATYRLHRRSDPAEAAPTYVAIKDTGSSLTVNIDRTLLTRYHYADVPARPYFYPLLTATGREVTRAFPMRSDVAGESHDHPHHRSLWVAFGDVNGVDNWSEEPGHGSTRHDSVLEVVNGDVCGRFATSSAWITSEGRTLLRQRLQVTAWATPPEFRLLDFDIELTAQGEDVLFGDTKEGGILSVRVAGSMDAARGGRIENSYGALDEAENWGRSAHWCDYSGPVGDQIQGIAVMDHPLSFRYPTHWHVRNYGLMTANPFGYAAYTSGAKHGEHRLEQGETLRFHYRLLLHNGDANQGSVRARYLDFVSPPEVKISLSDGPFHLQGPSH